MTRAEAVNKLMQAGIDHDANHLADALRYALYNYRPAKLSCYACECKHCELVLYTNTKRLNCEYCGSSDPEVFTCTELKE